MFQCELVMRMIRSLARYIRTYLNKSTIGRLSVIPLIAVSLSACGIATTTKKNLSDAPVNVIEPVDASKNHLKYYSDWPKIKSVVPKDPAIETDVAVILAKMTLEEKIGQMIQPSLDQVTPAEAKQYKLGSLLNGGGSWPAKNKRASAMAWARTADAYWEALDEAYQGRGFKIPFIWATDAVHGHNNVFGATVFPHNIGLGAANDPDLIYRIGKVTAKEVAATGLDWTFAPTVAVPRNDRWGRVYEGYSEDPEIVYRYAGKMVEGLQGGAEGLKSDTQVIANVKHWIGDGGTSHGVDRGKTHASLEDLINIHAVGYFSGLEAGAQAVMSSFNSWHSDENYDLSNKGGYNKKVHGSKYLITDVIKNRMGFDGIVVTDWNGHKEVNGCSASSCSVAVNAGNDVFMVTARNDWKAFYKNVIAQVNDGTISMERIDDAVTRILRVKKRANLWKKPRPLKRSLAGNQAQIGSPENRELAREAVRKSLVLLKNNADTLPLNSTQKIYLGGSAANNLAKQTGGWTLTWQGTDNKLQDFPGATTLKMALGRHIGADNVITELSKADSETIAIIAIGEDPYAEFSGDIKKHQTLSFAKTKATYAADIAAVKAAKDVGLKVVTVFFSGRPMYINDGINQSDAFVAAWLPGTEADGIIDNLYQRSGADFTGRLSYSWPNKACSDAINRSPQHIQGYNTPDYEQDIDSEHKPLFAYGYGLSYSTKAANRADLNTLTLDDPKFGCGQDSEVTTALEIYGRNSANEFVLRISGAKNSWKPIPIPAADKLINQGDLVATSINYQGQYDAVNVKFAGGDTAQLYLQTQDHKGQGRKAYQVAESTLQFDIRMKQFPTGPLKLAQHCEWPCHADVAMNAHLPKVGSGWKTLKVPVKCFVEKGMNYNAMNTPFLMVLKGKAEFDLGNIRLVPKNIDAAADALNCASLE